jgi:hypothetical protein
MRAREPRLAATMCDMRMPWIVRSVLAGAAGTAAMTLAYEGERRWRGSRRALDYDDSVVPGQIVGGILHLGNVSPREDVELGLALRMGYGSAFGVWHGILRRFMPEPYAGIAFGTTLLTATFTAFPVLGRTPPPWEWPKDVLATAVGTHVVYALAVAVVDDVLSPSMAAADAWEATELALD